MFEKNILCKDIPEPELFFSKSLCHLSPRLVKSFPLLEKKLCH